MVFTALLIILFQFGDVQSQNSVECNFNEILESDLESIELVKESDARWALAKDDGLATTHDPVDIPIIFHILYDETNETQSINQDELYSTYIDILQRMNADYNMLNEDITTEMWQDRIGNMSMTFFINKIVYVPVGTNSPYIHDDYDKIQSTDAGGHSPIDPAHNLDFYFIFPSTSFAAYAWLPIHQTELNRHGTTINMKYLNDTTLRPTIYTHEIGHWIGLYHVWGNNNADDDDPPKCYNATGAPDDDKVDDTPNMAATYAQQCPDDWTANTCDEGEDGDEPDMWDNFMSYALCRNMFTAEQVQRSRTDPGFVGMRDTFYDYQEPEHMTDVEFVNMFYFVDAGENCMPGDDGNDFCVNRKNKHKKCKKYRNCDVSLCISYSQSKFANVYEDIELIVGDDTECSTEYMKIDTILLTRFNEDGQEENIYTCYKKVNQTELPWDSTIVDLELELSDNGLELTLYTAGGDEIDKTVRLYADAPSHATKKPRKNKKGKKNKKHGKHHGKGKKW